MSAGPAKEFGIESVAEQLSITDLEQTATMSSTQII
jgi:hypothetical protein